MAALLGFSVSAVAAMDQDSAPAPASLDQTLPIQTGKWTGDLGGMAKRREIRALVVSSKMFYFVDRGTQRGATYDALRLFEKYLNERLRTGKVPVSIVYFPVRRDQIIPMLLDGRGDIAAADLTVTPERRGTGRLHLADPFRRQRGRGTGPASPTIRPRRPLRKGGLRSQVVELLREPGAPQHEVRGDGQAAGRLREAPEDLQDEDLLEMLNAGLVRASSSTDDIADFWKKIFPDIHTHPDVAVAHRGEIALDVPQGQPASSRPRVDGFAARNTRRARSCGNEILDEIPEEHASG